MKTIITTIFLVGFTLVASAQDKYDQFMEAMKVENETKTFVNNYIDKLASESNGVNAAKWSDIKSKIDYSSYLRTVKGILMDNYTITEIDDIFAANDMLSVINDTGQFIYKPKPEVKEQMYRVSRTFGKFINIEIKKLIEN